MGGTIFRRLYLSIKGIRMLCLAQRAHEFSGSLPWIICIRFLEDGMAPVCWDNSASGTFSARAFPLFLIILPSLLWEHRGFTLPHDACYRYYRKTVDSKA